MRMECLDIGAYLLPSPQILPTVQGKRDEFKKRGFKGQGGDCYLTKNCSSNRSNNINNAYASEPMIPTACLFANLRSQLMMWCSTAWVRDLLHVQNAELSCGPKRLLAVSIPKVLVVAILNLRC